MVTKSELLETINTRFDYVKVPELIITERFGNSTKKTYRIQSCRADGILGTILYYCMHVFDEGTANEAAYIETQQAPDELKTT